MIIDSSKIGMESARRYTSINYRAAKYTVGRGGSMSNDLFGNFITSGQDDENEQLNKTKEKKASNRDFIDSQWRSMTNTGKVRNISQRANANAMSRLRQQCIMYILDFLCQGRNSRKNTEVSENAENPYELPLQTARPLEVSSLTRTYMSYESEETAFSTTGKVVTADGRTIDFNMDIYMSREVASYYEETLSVQNVFLDPLVINLDSDIASVSDQKFYFDLDADGEKESISRLNSGSGYLALDKNGNGIIDDGSELFGTRSGDGFLDLSEYDVDGNGWIDEADPIFEKLLIWTQNEDGEDELYHLKDKGVGALCLQRIPTEHSLNSPLSNTTNAVLRSTGLFLYENGEVGSMQQLDLAR